MTTIEFMFSFGCTVTAICCSGCLGQHQLVFKEPGARMVIIRRGNLVLDGTTSNELDARLGQRQASDLRGFIEETPGDLKVPVYDSELLDDVISVLVDGQVSMVLILPGPTKKDEATADLLESRLRAADISALTARERTTTPTQSD